MYIETKMYHSCIYIIFLSDSKYMYINMHITKLILNCIQPCLFVYFCCQQHQPTITYKALFRMNICTPSIIMIFAVLEVLSCNCPLQKF